MVTMRYHLKYMVCGLWYVRMPMSDPEHVAFRLASPNPTYRQQTATALRHGLEKLPENLCIPKQRIYKEKQIKASDLVTDPPSSS